MIQGFVAREATLEDNMVGGPIDANWCLPDTFHARWPETLRDHVHVLIRPNRAEDLAVGNALIQGLASCARRLRLLWQIGKPSEALVSSSPTSTSATDGLRGGDRTIAPNTLRKTGAARPPDRDEPGARIVAGI